MRRYKVDDLVIVRAIAGTVIGLICICILNPNFRNALLGIGAIVVVLVFVLILGFLAFRLATAKGKRASSNDHTRAYFWCLTGTTEAEKDSSSKPMPFVLPSDPVPSSKPELKPIDRLREIDWYQFERIVAYVYEQRGFSVTRKGGANPDGGVDMVIEKNGQRFAVQCEQWKTQDVGVKAIREFLGALTDSKIERGIFITLNGYTGEAKQLAEKHGIEIINETGLRRMVEGLDLRAQKIQEIFDGTLKICPKCERPLVIRTPRKGGEQFWGCSGFPQGCRFTMPI